MTKASVLPLILCTWVVYYSPPPSVAAEGPRRDQQTSGLEDIRQYIASGWDSLTRSMTRCDSVSDSKAPDKSVMYLPADSPAPAAVLAMQKNCSIRVERLPAVIEKLGQVDVSSIRPSGLLYLDHPYVVPGGRFNEMYGWDSYFIIRGLLRDGRVDLARGMVENFLFEIDHYGGVLNANRTYYLTRSQPPFLTSMILAVYEAEKSKGKDGPAWLAKAYTHAVKDYDLWTHEPHLVGHTGLSRYYDFGDGPVPEMADSPSYYRRVARYFLLHPEGADAYLVRSAPQGPGSSLTGTAFPVYVCEAEGSSRSTAGDCDQVEEVSLTRDYYKGDRSMRESGFDVSFRFGPYSAGTHHYAPVCLNSLLYKTEQDLEQISAELGRKQEAQEWRQRALKRREAINQYLWNEQRGLFFDYNFETHAQSSYEFATTFYTLWAGVATPEQARAVVRNLKVFEHPGGLAMGHEETGAQWDYPFGWAPIQLLAVEGLRRYGYDDEANRLSHEFLSTVLRNFRRDRTIREKYNVITGSSETQIEAGYNQNVVGFGWTNGVFLELLRALPETLANRLAVK